MSDSRKLTQSDKNVVANLRYQYGDKLAQYSDEHIAITWRDFSGSDDYIKDKDLILEWL